MNAKLKFQLPIHIRLAKSTDLNCLNQLMYLSKAIWGYDKQFMDKFITEHGISLDYLTKEEIYLYTNEDMIIGFYSFSLREEILELEHFFVKSSLIGGGIGATMWQHACNTAKNKYNVDKFILCSDPEAQGFYLRMGCRIIGQRKSTMAENRYPPVMEYDLNLINDKGLA